MALEAGSVLSSLVPGSLKRSLVAFTFLVGLVLGIMTAVSLPGAAVNMVQQVTLRQAPQSPVPTPPSAPLLHTPGARLQARGHHRPRPTPGAVKKEPRDEDSPHAHPHSTDREEDAHPVITFEDEHHHHDDSHVADTLAGKIRILCWVMTQPKSHEKKARHVKATWGKRCNRLLFISEEDDPSLPAINVHVGPGRGHLTAKTMKAFDHIYHNHINDFDWFLKADDDTYVIVENLRYMLSAHNPTQEVYFGHHFYSEKWTDMYQGYFSGGAGYVLSQAALTKFAKRPPGLCRTDGGSEDVEMGYCMERLNITTGDSRDALGRSRFHCFGPKDMLSGRYPDWYREFDKYGAKSGMGNMSDYTVSFHYVPPKEMYALEFYVYHLRPFGIATGQQTLNT